jgi:alkylation response protein AidB-like acyl-CoA dehydrogenase
VIDFSLAPELEVLRATAASLAADHLRPCERESESARAIRPEARKAFLEIGLAGLELPEGLGGAGLGALARALVLEELAAADPGAALALDPLGPALYPIAELGEPADLETWLLPLLARQGARAVLAYDPDGEIAVSGDRAMGSIPWVPCDRPDVVVVLNREGAFLVDDRLGCKPVRGSGLRAAGAASLELAGAPIRARWTEPRAAGRALARARLYVAGLLLGVMRAAAEYARSYACERVAFGRPIAHHQALAFLITDMHAAVEGVRLLVHEAAWRLDTGRPGDEACATALLEASEQAMFVTPHAVQILGGHGFMQDYPVEKWMREARALSLLLGSPDRSREAAGRALAALEPPLELTSSEARG